MQATIMKVAAAATLFATALAQNSTTDSESLLSAGYGGVKLNWFDTKALVPASYDNQAYGCKCYAGEACWPQLSVWRQLNQTVNGQLKANIPAAAVCHNSFTGPLGTVNNTYNAQACAAVTANWVDEEWTVSQPAEYIWSYATGSSCLPTTDPTTPCTAGFTGTYVITAKTEAHVKAGINFARKNNIRLIVRNTGHDFLGRSTGYGALIINTHSFQSINFVNRYLGPGSYRGSAVTIGAGVQGKTLLTAAHQQNPPLAVVTGECPTVGLAGFMQGGGHGPWSPLKGFSVDNVLSFKVLTASGETTTANVAENPDLFWALKGGGPASFAVILSITMKTFPDLPAIGATLDTNFTHTFDFDTFYKAPTIFHSYANHFVDNGLYVYFELVTLLFRVRPFVAINQTLSQFEATLAPFLAEMDLQNVPYDFTVKEFPTFYDLYIDLFEAEAAHTNALTGGWMFNHDDVANNNAGIMDAFKTNLAPAPNVGGFMIGHLFNPGHTVKSGDNAMHPGWRNATDFVIAAFLVPDDASPALKDQLNAVVKDVTDPALRGASTSGVTYIHESDPRQANWQSHFWGSNYPRLQQARSKWDPRGIFYAVSTPGTEAWEMKENNTRLCKKL